MISLVTGPGKRTIAKLNSKVMKVVGGRENGFDCLRNEKDSIPGKTLSINLVFLLPTLIPLLGYVYSFTVWWGWLYCCCEMRMGIKVKEIFVWLELLFKGVVERSSRKQNQLARKNGKQASNLKCSPGFASFHLLQIAIPRESK